jgi:hypothetical protein
VRFAVIRYEAEPHKAWIDIVTTRCDESAGNRSHYETAVRVERICELERTTDGVLILEPNGIEAKATSTLKIILTVPVPSPLKCSNPVPAVEVPSTGPASR